METALTDALEHPAIPDGDALERVYRAYRRLPVEGGERDGHARVMDVFQFGLIAEAALRDLLHDGPRLRPDA